MPGKVAPVQPGLRRRASARPLHAGPRHARHARRPSGACAWLCVAPVLPPRRLIRHEARHSRCPSAIRLIQQGNATMTHLSNGTVVTDLDNDSDNRSPLHPRLHHPTHRDLARSRSELHRLEHPRNLRSRSALLIGQHPRVSPARVGPFLVPPNTMPPDRTRASRALRASEAARRHAPLPGGLSGVMAKEAHRLLNGPHQG